MIEEKKEIITVNKITKGLENEISNGVFHAHIEAYECSFNCNLREVIFAASTILCEAEQSLSEKDRERFRTDFLTTLNELRRNYNDPVNSKK